MMHLYMLNVSWLYIAAFFGSSLLLMFIHPYCLCFTSPYLSIIHVYDTCILCVYKYIMRFKECMLWWFSYFLFCHAYCVEYYTFLVAGIWCCCQIYTRLQTCWSNYHYSISSNWYRAVYSKWRYLSVILFILTTP